LKELAFNLINFYKMNWYGFAIGHYMVWLVLVGIALVTLETYIKAHKNKNDVRRFFNADRG
jgi:hypothetical protein